MSERKPVVRVSVFVTCVTMSVVVYRKSICIHRPIEMSFQAADKATGPVIVPTGIRPPDSLLDGGLELGLTYLIYGGKTIRELLHRILVHVQHTGSPTIMIDSANTLNIERITHYSHEAGLQPEDVMDNTFISRAFNSSQSYDLVMNQLDSFFERIPARSVPLSHYSSGICYILHISRKTY